MDYNLQKNQNAEQTYHSIRNSIVSAQHRLSTAVNSAMVTTYWEIGEQIFIHSSSASIILQDNSVFPAKLKMNSDLIIHCFPTRSLISFDIYATPLCFFSNRFTFVSKRFTFPGYAE